MTHQQPHDRRYPNKNGRRRPGTFRAGRGTRERNVIYASRHDTRTNTRIAGDMSRNTKEIVEDPADWDPEGNDLLGWDTTHITEFRGEHAAVWKDTKKQLNTLFPGDQVEGRVKMMPSVVEKLKRKNQTEDFTEKDMEDYAGLRVTFDNTQDLMRGAKRIRERYQVRSEDDYITHPSASGYRSYHLTIVNQGKPVEVQLRTPSMTRWADWSHETLYKNREQIQGRVGTRTFKEAERYSLEMSGYYDQQDRGIPAARPTPTPGVQQAFGELQ